MKCHETLNILRQLRVWGFFFTFVRAPIYKKKNKTQKNQPNVRKTVLGITII